jgi:hypothetical protein
MAYDFLVICCKLFEERSFPSYAVEIKELLGASIAKPEPGYCAELMVPRDLFLQGVGQVALCCREYVLDCFILKVSL